MCVCVCVCVCIYISYVSIATAPRNERSLVSILDPSSRCTFIGRCPKTVGLRIGVGRAWLGRTKGIGELTNRPATSRSRGAAVSLPVNIPIYRGLGLGLEVKTPMVDRSLSIYRYIKGEARVIPEAYRCWVNPSSHTDRQRVAAEEQRCAFPW